MKPYGKVERNMDTPESRKFWREAVKAAEEVAKWPAWKRAGVNGRRTLGDE